MVQGIAPGPLTIAPGLLTSAPLWPAAPVATGVARAVNVLLVEDDEDAAVLTSASLMAENDPFCVEWAENLSAAMIRLLQPGIDVILLDLGMPELSGYRSYRAIELAMGSKLPVVILTSDDREDSKILTLGSGAAAYLLKNQVSPARLRRTLHNALLP